MAIPGEWTVHGERSIYDSEWMSMRLVDVETPSGSRFEHHVVRMPFDAAGTLVVVDDAVLLIWRHRFISDTWGWDCLLYTSPSPRDYAASRMPSSA